MGGGRPRNRPPPLLKGALRPLLPAPCTAPGPEGRAGLGLGGVRGGGEEGPGLSASSEEGPGPEGQRRHRRGGAPGRRGPGPRCLRASPLTPPGPLP